MEAFELVRLFVNKTVVSEVTKRRGNSGYQRLQVVRLLVYPKLRCIAPDKGLVRNLKKNRLMVRALGFQARGCWKRVKGLRKKADQVYAGLISLLTISLKAVINGESNLRKVSQC